MAEIEEMVVIEEDSAAEDDRTEEEKKTLESRAWRYKHIIENKVPFN